MNFHRCAGLSSALHNARYVDRSESQVVTRGRAFFHVSGSGHEALAVLARHLIPADYLHCHYRDKALLLARGMRAAEFLHGVLCNAAGGSGGRQMSAHVCSRGHNVLSIVGPVGNHALQAAGVAAEIKDRDGRPIVLCSMGDGTSQQGEVLEAIAEAVRWTLPVLFIIQDNRYSISMKTQGKTFFSLPAGRGAAGVASCELPVASGELPVVSGELHTVAGRELPGEPPATKSFPPTTHSPPPAPLATGNYQLATSDPLATSNSSLATSNQQLPTSFYGLPIHRLDGRDALALDEPLGEIVQRMRQDRRPAIVVLEVERLCDHTNSDDQAVYRSPEEIAHARQTGDPLVILKRKLIESGVPAGELEQIEREAEREVQAGLAAAMAAPQPQAVFTAKRELPERLTARESEYLGIAAGGRLTMGEAIRGTLRARMNADPRITLYGEDIEDPKGDVFGITRGLTDAFGGRVRNSPVSESTIVGTSIGRALAGGWPVAFIQFADFLPLAFNQIATELGSMYWRTNGQWECPVIVMIACGGYRPGLGPFHSHTLESVACHVPGVDVAMPSNAADAAGALNAAFESGRPTLFFYPKAMLNNPEQTTSADVEKQLAPIGLARLRRTGSDITLVAWGNTVGLCEQASDALSGVGCSADVIDLRWLSPWDEAMVIDSARKTGRLIVVHEDNRTCGFGAEVVATVAEKAGAGVRCRRITRADTYVPCNFANQLEVLPSYKDVLSAAADMLDLELTWEQPPEAEAGIVTIDAIGSSPSDEEVMIVNLKATVGQSIAAGDCVACLDCEKALFDVASAVSGTVIEVYVKPGDTVRVGMPMIAVRTDGPEPRAGRRVRGNAAIARLRRR